MAKKKSAVGISRKSKSSKREESRKKSAYGFYIVSAVALALLLALIFALSYSASLSQMIRTSVVINPPIRFFVGTPPVNVSGIINVPANQIFCPENRTVVKSSDESFSYNYYTELSGNEEFTYSFAQNSSNVYSFAVVEKPFTLVSYSSATVNSSVCAGYPNAKHLFVLKIAAPRKYIGPLYISLYR